MTGEAPYNPDVFSAATLMATRDGVSVDVALAQLRRRARAAGLSPPEMATLIITGAAVGTSSSARQTETPRP